MKRHSTTKQKAPRLISRRRAFTIITIAFPFVFLCLSEATLRLFNYGQDLSLFRTERIAGREYSNMNPGVKGRYFASVTFNPVTSMDFFLRLKNPDTYRIFCLGGSTTAGYPYGYAGSFPTFLKQRLNAIFPDKPLEIINLGLTATNSFTTLDFAHEILDLGPDLILVYDGHNEFYGALGVASNESVAQSRRLTELYLGLLHFKTFVLLRDAYTGVLSLADGSDSVSQSGSMMERLSGRQAVPYGGRIYRLALETYRENVCDLLDLFRSRNIPIILANQVSNLRDQPPFLSGTSDTLPSDRKQELHRLLASARSSLEAGSPGKALPLLQQCVALDSMAAETRFLLAISYDRLNMKQKALREYILARDYDQLRFRMSSDFNRVAQLAADSLGGIFVDIEKAFCRESPDSIAGNGLILDHLHPNERGYFIMAREYTAAMRENGLLADSTEWARCDTIDEDVLWENRILTELDRRAGQRRVEILTSQWPFRHEKRIPVPPSDRIGWLAEDLLNGRKSWEEVHVEAANYYEEAGQMDLAEKEYEIILFMVPVNVSPLQSFGKELP